MEKSVKKRNNETKETTEDEITSKLNELTLKQCKVGYVFDERMLQHKDFDNMHVEKPERAMSIYMNLIFKGLIANLIRLPSEEITEKDLLRVHTKEYVKTISNLIYDSDPNSPNETKLRMKTENKRQLCFDTYDSFYTYDAAKISAGSLLSCCKKVASGKVDNAFAIIRPPGHHANSSNCRGFCFFNNVAVAAAYLINECKMKVAIVDWDVHHGDGTQEIFYNQSNPLKISIHRHDNGTFYPSVTGKMTEFGEAEGKYYNINIPWNTRGFFSGSKSSIGDDEYYYAFQTVVIPVLKEYKPDIILVSCGFDAAENDPLGNLSISPLGYAYMTYQLMKICNKIVVELEGGYNLDSLARCSEAIIRTMLNDTSGFKNILLKKEIDELNLNFATFNSRYFCPSSYAIEQVNAVKTLLENYWVSLKNENIQNPKRNFVRKNNSHVLSSVSKLFGEKYSKEFLLDTDEKMTNFMKFKIGQSTIPTVIGKINRVAFQRKVNIDNRTLSRQLQFRLEGIHIDNSKSNSIQDYRYDWDKTEGIFDTTEEDISTFITKFIEKNKINLIDVLNKIDQLIASFEECFLVSKNDFYNVDLYFIPIEVNPIDENTRVTRSKKKLFNQISLKLNGFKDYALIEVENKDSKNPLEGQNFLNGLKSLREFISSNVIS